MHQLERDLQADRAAAIASVPVSNVVEEATSFENVPIGQTVEEELEEEFKEAREAGPRCVCVMKSMSDVFLLILDLYSSV